MPWRGEGLKSALLGNAVVFAALDVVAAAEVDVTSFEVGLEPEVVGAASVDVVSASAGLESAGATVVVVGAGDGDGASLVVVESPVITCQSCGETPEKVSSVTVPLHPPLPQHIQSCDESSHCM